MTERFRSSPVYDGCMVVPANKPLFPNRWRPDAILRCNPVWHRRGDLVYRRDVGADVWQTPTQTDQLGGGDCEDLSIWWLAKEIRTGNDRRDFALVVGRLPDGREHAVGEICGDGGPLYYDCLRDGIRGSLPGFTPLYRLELLPTRRQWLCIKMRKRSNG
jgi:hypothetical protein